jgi:hypothetical protein
MRDKGTLYLDRFPLGSHKREFEPLSRGKILFFPGYLSCEYAAGHDLRSLGTQVL